MYKIRNITQDARQTFILNIPGVDNATLDLEYSSTQMGWFFSITQGDFQIANLRLCSAPNILRQWKNILVFGIACISNDKQDPMQIDSFSSEQSTLYFLEAADVASVEATFYV